MHANKIDTQVYYSPYTGVCGFFLSVKFATYLFALLAGDNFTLNISSLREEGLVGSLHIDCDLSHEKMQPGVNELKSSMSIFLHKYVANIHMHIYAYAKVLIHIHIFKSSKIC